MRRLSKSKVMAWLQCPKRLWLEIHRPELLQFSARAEQSFAIGHEVGAAAQGLCPDGVPIGFQGELSEALAETDHLLGSSGNRVLFEPAFQHAGVLVRADILERRGNGFHLIEVKSSTSAKPHYFNDIAIQTRVIAGAGHAVSSVELWHIDNTFVYLGDGQYDGLFVRLDLTNEIADIVGQVPGWVSQCQQVLSGPQPEIAVGKQCTEPYECPFISHCSPAEAEYPVFILPYGRALAGRLRLQGYKDLRDVPQDRLNSERHLRVWRSTRTGQAELDSQAAQALAALPYPRYYLDFETAQFAVPIWAGTRPYEQLPFQWSCHIEHREGQLSHREFLDTAGLSPMRRFAETLIAAVGKEGPILVYSTFENTVLNNLIDRFPDLRKELEEISARFVDLLLIARNHYYHPAMMGSWSIKAVLPTIAPELAYDTLGEVQEGGGAQDAYRAIISPDTTDDRRVTLMADLRAYCRHDTLAMVEIARFFEGRHAH